MNSFVRKFAGLLLLIVFSVSASAQSLDEAFRKPSGDAKPWTLWYWMYGAISEEGVRADLRSMADAGLGGA